MAPKQEQHFSSYVYIFHCEVRGKPWIEKKTHPQEIQYSQATAESIKAFFNRHPGAGEAVVAHGFFWGIVRDYTHGYKPISFRRIGRLCHCPAVWLLMLLLRLLCYRWRRRTSCFNPGTLQGCKIGLLISTTRIVNICIHWNINTYIYIYMHVEVLENNTHIYVYIEMFW